MTCQLRNELCGYLGSLSELAVLGVSFPFLSLFGWLAQTTNGECPVRVWHELGKAEHVADLGGSGTYMT